MCVKDDLCEVTIDTYVKVYIYGEPILSTGAVAKSVAH